MRRLAIGVMVAAALPLAAQEPKGISDAEYSRRLTAAAEDLLAAERKVADRWREAAQAASPDTEAGQDVANKMYEDVISLLDEALNADPQNLHAHRVAADVLLVKSDTGNGKFDVCYLLDARDQAGYVLDHASHAAAPDLARAKTVVKTIATIPPSAISGKESDCDDQEEDMQSGGGTIAAFRGARAPSPRSAVEHLPRSGR